MRLTSSALATKRLLLITGLILRFFGAKSSTFASVCEKPTYKPIQHKNPQSPSSNMKKPLLLSVVPRRLSRANQPTAATTVTEPTLTNISTRAFVQTGDNVVIGGFFVEGVQQF